MPRITIVHGGRNRLTGMDTIPSPTNERLLSSNSHGTEGMFARQQLGSTLMHTPSKSGSKAWTRLDPGKGDDNEDDDDETIARSCFSPDSVMAWPTGEHDVSPVKRHLALKSPPATPQAIDGDNGVVNNLGPTRSEEAGQHTLLTPSNLSHSNMAELVDKHNTMPRDEKERHVSTTKRVSFADGHGSPLIEVRVLEPPLYQRMVLLLISPHDRKFEFLHLEYPLDDNTTVQVVLDQVPKVAANPLFQRFTFNALARTSKNEKLENDQVMGDCELADNELVLGIPMGYAMTHIGQCAVPLLLNGNIIKAVNRAKKSGKGLKTLKSGHEWRRRGKPRKIPKSWTRQPKDAASSISSPRQHHDNVIFHNAKGVDELESYSSSTTDQDMVHWCPLPVVAQDETETSNVTTAEDRTTTSKCFLEANARSVVDQLVSNNDEDDDIPEMETEEEVAAAATRDCNLLDANQTSAAPSSNSSTEGLPDMDNPDWVYPDLVNDYLGGGTEKVVFWIHAVSIAAVGYLSTMALR